MAILRTGTYRERDISREKSPQGAVESRLHHPFHSCPKVWLDLVRSVIVVPLGARVASVRPAVVTATSSGATINWMLSFVKLPMGQGDWPRPY
jgi:hypothetical protein